MYIHVYVYMLIGRALAWKVRSRGFESHLRQLIFCLKGLSQVLFCCVVLCCVVCHLQCVTTLIFMYIIILIQIVYHTCL